MVIQHNVTYCLKK